MFRNIYIAVLLSFGFCGISFGLIQVTDRIFPSDNVTPSVVKPTTGTSSTGTIKTTTSTGSNTGTAVKTGAIIKTGTKVTTNTTSSTGNNSGSTTANKNLASSLGTGLAADIDFVQGVRWMYENGLTSYKNINDYRPYDKVTREEVAKMMSKLYDVEGLNLQENSGGCVFKDSNKFSSSMSSYIYKVCSLGIMNGGNGYFLPSKTITRAQGLAIIIRLFEEKGSNEKLTPRYSEYYDKGLKYNFIPKTMKLGEMDIGLSRYRLAKYIYNFHIKSNFKGSETDLDNNPIVYDNFWDVVPNTTAENKDDQSITDMKVHIKSNQLASNLSAEFPIVLDTKDKIVMVKITSTYKNTDKTEFVRYGDLYDTKDNLVGSSTFIYSNGIIKEGYLRFDSGITYRVALSSETLDKNIYDVFKKNYN